MARLREVASEAGLSNPRTLLQSGNLVFEDTGSSAGELEKSLNKALRAALGLEITFMVRTLTEWKQIVRHNPYAQEAKDDPSHLLVIAMSDAPEKSLVDSVQKAMVGPERFVCRGRELYVVFPEGIGNSKIGKVKGWNKLASQGTARNWNTVLKLVDLAESK